MICSVMAFRVTLTLLDALQSLVPRTWLFLSIYENIYIKKDDQWFCGSLFVLSKLMVTFFKRMKHTDIHFEKNNNKKKKKKKKKNVSLFLPYSNFVWNLALINWQNRNCT